MAVPARRHTTECAASPGACSCNAPDLSPARKRRVTIQQLEAQYEARYQADREAAQARDERMRCVLSDVLRDCVDQKAHAFAYAQRSLCAARALVAELGGVLPEVDEATERWLADEKRGGGR